MISRKYNNLTLFLAILTLVGCSYKESIDSPHKYLQDNLKLGVAGPKLVIIPKGKGLLGGMNSRSFRNEEPIYFVSIDQDIAISVTEITFEQYDLYCNAAKVKCPDDKGWGRGRQPVMNVSWNEAVAYTDWISKQTGQTYRLCSEEEWEYAARAGTNTKFWWGDEYQQGMDHCDRDMGNCPKGTDLGRPVPAGHFKVNPFGLLDVTSNVGEWVLDCVNPNHQGAAGDGTARLDGDCKSRIVKGSDWRSPQPYVHLSKRWGFEKGSRAKEVGFRVVRELR